MQPTQKYFLNKNDQHFGGAWAISKMTNYQSNHLLVPAWNLSHKMFYTCKTGTILPGQLQKELKSEKNFSSSAIVPSWNFWNVWPKISLSCNHTHGPTCAPPTHAQHTHAHPLIYPLTLIHSLTCRAATFKWTNKQTNCLRMCEISFKTISKLSTISQKTRLPIFLHLKTF